MNFQTDFLILDLELNQILQPDGTHQNGSIIEIGAYWYQRDHRVDGYCDDPDEAFCYAVESQEPLSAYIKTLCPHLTGAAALPLNAVMDSLDRWTRTKNRAFKVAAWGNDGKYLLDTLAERSVCVSSKLFTALNRSVDLRNYVEMASVMLNKKRKGKGLRGHMEAWGLGFVGTQHRANVDAWNTARLLRNCATSLDQVRGILG
jgi:inhibitor of KinA sporulation pathway (predicted exonuclease)